MFRMGKIGAAVRSGIQCGFHPLRRGRAVPLAVWAWDSGMQRAPALGGNAPGLGLGGGRGDRERGRDQAASSKPVS